MPRFVLLCLLPLSISAASAAQEIYKCATPTGISYQGVPCEGRQLPGPIVAASAAPAAPADNPGARGVPECGARPLQPRRLPWRQATICIGMTDDEVLNLGGWGRPEKIARSRAPREWREEWTYGARAGGPRRLHFLNGKLEQVETDAADVRVASVESAVSN